ncbi:MAG TPA: hypothetical protein VN933_13230 [Candidatus Eremiobacteraceae bacterium]|jgi:hypothetical protein|nr:hypothetical protein [Candidatus Eremiobacteraceae bacterium]
MKKASKIEAKTAPAKKANVKIAAKKTATTVSPRLAANHNETLHTR